MNQYMLLFRNEKQENPAPPPADQMKMMMEQWREWIAGIAKDGKFGGTNRLLSEGKSIKPGMIITNGPYVELKEMVGGYVIVKANSIDEAVEIAKGCPNLVYGGNVEVRTVMAIDEDPSSATFLYPKQ